MKYDIHSPIESYTTFREKDERFYFDAGDFSYEISALMRDVSSGSEVEIDVRPESISISKTRTPKSIPSEVYVYEPLGSQIIVGMKVGASLFKVKAPPKVDLKIGEKVFMTFEENKVHVFDSKTDRTI
jgi:ABC-type sugar transport system ATPase subunit